MSRRLLAPASTIFLTAFGFAPPWAEPWLFGMAVAVAGTALIRRHSLVSPWCLFVALLMALKIVTPRLDSWPLHWLIPLAGAVFYCGTVRGAAPVSSWASLGSMAAGVKLLTVAITTLSAIVFLLWATLSNAEPGSHGFAGLTMTEAVFAGVMFAITNAAMEELVFRGLSLRALQASFSKPGVAILVQALAFGALHYRPPSVPDGLEGASLTFLYGFALGGLAHAARGILAPFLAHVVADILVFLVMIGWT